MSFVYPIPNADSFRNLFSPCLMRLLAAPFVTAQQPQAGFHPTATLMHSRKRCREGHRPPPPSSPRTQPLHHFTAVKNTRIRRTKPSHAQNSARIYPYVPEKTTA
jgi:hypothetical protein